MSIIIYGPQGCGKNLNAAKIAKHFGLDNVLDDYMIGDTLPENTLALTNLPNAKGAKDFFDVMSEISNH